MIKAIVVIATLSASSAQAFWGGPFYDGMTDVFGDFSINFSMKANTRTNIYGYGYNSPYYGYPHAPVTSVAPKAESK